MEVLWDSFSHSINLKSHERTHSGQKSCGLGNMGKYSHIPVSLKYMKELTMERNHMDISNVRKPFLTSRYHKKHEQTPCRESVHVSNVRKPPHILVPIKGMKELTLERNLIDASYVGKPSQTPLFFESMKEFTVNRNPMFVSNVVRHF
jgi:hypothetical protein